MKHPIAEDDGAETETDRQLTLYPTGLGGVPAPVSRAAGNAWISGVMVLARDGFPFLDRTLPEIPGARRAPVEPGQGEVLAPARTPLGPPVTH